MPSFFTLEFFIPGEPTEVSAFYCAIASPAPQSYGNTSLWGNQPNPSLARVPTLRTVCSLGVVGHATESGRVQGNFRIGKWAPGPS